MQRQVVAVAEHFVSVRTERHVTPELLRHLRNEGIVRQNLHGKASRTPRHISGNGAEADQAQGLLIDIVANQRVPIPCSHIPLCHGNLPCAVEHHAERQVCNRIGIGSCSIGHGNAQFFCFRQIEVIQTGSVLAYQLQMWAFFHQLRRKFMSANNQYIILRNHRRKGLHVELIPVKRHIVSCLFQQVHGFLIDLAKRAGGNQQLLRHGSTLLFARQ